MARRKRNYNALAAKARLEVKTMGDWISAATDRELVEALCDVDEGLSEWEMTFVDSVSKQGGSLSPKQREKAEQIMRKVETT